MKLVTPETLAAALWAQDWKGWPEPPLLAEAILAAIPPDPRLASDAAVLGAHLAGGCTIGNLSRDDLERYLAAYRDRLISNGDPRLDALLAAARDALWTLDYGDRPGNLDFLDNHRAALRAALAAFEEPV
jgi:hypothetical protein